MDEYTALEKFFIIGFYVCASLVTICLGAILWLTSIPVK